ncbi:MULTISPECIES: hypothetical protein [Clostridium]|nr:MULTISPECIES: hypothetical protein [Clostridium]MDU7337248.1 hypothetical protein [Clostridium sp.]
MPQIKQKKTNASNHALWVRIVALVCALLIGGSVLSIVFYL